MATCRSRAHDSLGARLLDVTVGLGVGVVVGVVLWGLTLWWWAVYG